jgi:hypothetical protein
MEKTSWPTHYTGWAMRSLESAAIRMIVSDNSRVRVCIGHELLKKISPKMMCWWFNHLEGVCEIDGVTRSRFQLWHPFDHLYCKILQPKSRHGWLSKKKTRLLEKTRQPGGRMVKQVYTIEKRTQHEVILTSGNNRGIRTTIHHLFQAINGGCKCDTIIDVYLPRGPLKLALELFAKKPLQDILSERLLIRHYVEEMGNLEQFLPELYWAEKYRTIGRKSFFESGDQRQKIH